jgi:hypothetical protein
MEPYARADHTVSSPYQVSFPPQLQGKVEGWGRPLLLVGHICSCLLDGTTNRKKEARGKGGNVRELTFCLRKYNLWSMGRPHA